jgi:hypothetical protein
MTLVPEAPTEKRFSRTGGNSDTLRKGRVTMAMLSIARLSLTLQLLHPSPPPHHLPVYIAIESIPHLSIFSWYPYPLYPLSRVGLALLSPWLAVLHKGEKLRGSGRYCISDAKPPVATRAEV